MIVSTQGHELIEQFYFIACFINFKLYSWKLQPRFKLSRNSGPRFLVLLENHERRFFLKIIMTIYFISVMFTPKRAHNSSA